MFLIEQLKLKCGYTKADLTNAAALRLGVFERDILHLEILREAVDARKKPQIFMVVNAAAELTAQALQAHGAHLADKKQITVERGGIEVEPLPPGILANAPRPVVVGFGPAGMFAALVLAKAGLRPVVVEQGRDAQSRKRDIEAFFNGGALDTSSNIQFGEGGAGTFSDGKLQSNLDSPLCKTILNELILCGAPEEIFYKSKPHIGSDKLPTVVKNLREKITALGGEVLFQTRLADIEFENAGALTQKRVCAAVIESGGTQRTLPADTLILAAGHSATALFEMLQRHGVRLEQKSFALGVRIEHSQARVNAAQYGAGVNAGILGAADYKLAVHLPSGRSVFTFCMCPGGSVVNASCEAGLLVTNGMSDFARGGEYANSALLVNVLTSDFGSAEPLAGLRFQQQWERAAFCLGGANHTAPAQSVAEFLSEKAQSEKIQSTMRPGIRRADISKCLPDFVTESLKAALPLLNKKIRGFAAPQDVLVAVESRSSSAVRIARGDDFQSVSARGLFVCGEGAGYAGGIMSSAVDGTRCAFRLIQSKDCGQS